MIIRSLINSFRLVVIVTILFRHHALFFWRGTPDFSKGKNLANALEALGPSFIKLGQILSTRSDIVGEEMALALAGLQDKVPPFSSDTVHQLIEMQLGKKTADVFASFDDVPKAAASIAQVHFAVLQDGKKVAVKVLRPNIEQAFARDIRLLYWLADIISYWMPSLQRFKLAEVTAEFEDMIKFELDLRFEAASAVQMKQNLLHDEGFYIPEIYWNYSSQCVLTLERIEGIPISDVETIIKAGHDPKRIVDEAAIGFFKQVFRDGFFHADMHPGNMFILPNGKIALVDFGIMGILDMKSRLYLAQILNYALKEDYYNLSRIHFDAGFVPPTKSVEKFALAMIAIMKPIMGRNLGDISVGGLLGQLFSTAKTFEMETQPHLLLLQKNMMLTEGIGRMLNPNVNMWQVAEPLIEAWAKKHLGVRAKLHEKAQETMSLLASLPLLVQRAEDALARVNNGGFKLHSDTVTSMRKERRSIYKSWLFFLWTALIVFTICYVTK